MSTQLDPPAAHPGFSTPPASGGDSAVTITAEELQRYRSIEAEHAKLQTMYTADIDAKESERLAALSKIGEIEKTVSAKDAELTQALAARGELERTFDAQRRAWESQINQATASVDAFRQRYLDREKSAAAAASLVGYTFAGESSAVQSKIAAKALRELETLLDATEDASGRVIVKEKHTGRQVADAVREFMGAPENQYLLAPRSRGGSGTDGTRSVSTQQQQSASENPHQPGSVEWAALRYKNSMVNASGLLLTPPRSNNA